MLSAIPHPLAVAPPAMQTHGYEIPQVGGLRPHSNVGPMETALSGALLDTTVPSANISPPNRAITLPALEIPGVPIVESEALRQCHNCRKLLPLTAFVGLLGQPTTSTCDECCVCILYILSFT